MKTKAMVTSLILCVSAGSLLSAQEAPEFPQPQKEHKWLQKFVGEWEISTEAMMEGPNGETMKCSGTMSSRMLGGFWAVNETTMNVPGMTVTAIQTIGYDTEKKKYVGTWIDSAMNHLWRYEGAVDESGAQLTLEAEGPNFMDAGKTTTFRDAYEFKSPDHIVVTSSMLASDGTWITFMTGEARRKK